MKRTLLVAALVAGCSGGGTGDDAPPVEREHDPALVGRWAVEQPNHALYEVTYYDLGADGSLVAASSEPAGCTDHLSAHCVTGSVARCLPRGDVEHCDATPSCVFADAWWSRGPETLVVTGACSDGTPRDIVLEPATGRVISVGGEPGWSHDNWIWAFRKL